MSILELPPLRGRRVAVVGGGGGNNVATGDICAEEGLDMPALSPETQKKLTSFISLVNQAVINPLDIAGVIGNVAKLRRVLEIIVADPLIDIIILSVSPGFWGTGEENVVRELQRCITELSRKEAMGKPIVVAIHDLGKPAETDEVLQDLRRAGITVYISLRRACRAINRVALYYQFIGNSK